MAKIVDINENDLKRIVKRVLSERRILNEDTLGKGEVDETTLESFKNALKGGQGPWEKLQGVVDACIGNIDNMGPPKQSDSSIASAAAKVWEGVNYQTWGFMVGTDEEKIKSAISSLQTIPDLCSMFKRYSDTYEDFYESIDSDFSGDEDIAIYVVAPIANIIQKQKAGSSGSSTGTSTGPVVGSGGTPVPTGSVTPNPNARGDGDVEDLQRLLKTNGFDIGRSGVDGDFGDDTLYATLKALRTYLK